MHASLLLCSHLHTCICALKKCNSHAIGTVWTQERPSEADSVCLNLRVVSCGNVHKPDKAQTDRSQKPGTQGTGHRTQGTGHKAQDTGHRAQLRSLLCESTIACTFLWEHSSSLASTELIQVVLGEFRMGLRKGPVTTRVEVVLSRALGDGLSGSGYVMTCSASFNTRHALGLCSFLKQSGWT